VLFGLGALLAFGTAAPAQALTNPDFDAGLTGWQTAGPVSAPAGELILADTGGADAAAWQAVPVAAPRTRLEFDVLGALSSFTPADPFGFPDVFAASIYLFDDPVGFAPDSGTALSALSVLSLDHTGAFDVEAILSPAARGDDWLHVVFEFDSPTAYVAPAFELFELAFTGGDSEVRVDGVSLAAVPEPGTALLLAVGLTGCAWRRRRGRAVRAP
jgi:hypothetical protein